MDREEAKAQIQGVIATVPTAFDSKYEVDYGLMAEATEVWIERGLKGQGSVLKVAAAMGEGPQLRDSEWGRLLETVVKAAKGRVPVMGAIHYKDTVRSIEDVKIAKDAGVIGLQVSPPVFNQPSQEDMLRYFGALSDGSDLGIMIYNTHWLTFGGIFPETFRRMKDFEAIVAIKWSPPEGYKFEEIFDLKDTFNIIDNTNNPMNCHKMGGHGFLSEGVDSYPTFFLNIWSMMEAGRYGEANSEWERTVQPMRNFDARTGKISGGEARMEKGISEIMGLPMGPPRPPSMPLNKAEMAELRQILIDIGWPVPNGAAHA
jgi:4-hydroxy-tetrahydrodipicolinate synthase